MNESSRASGFFLSQKITTLLQNYLDNKLINDNNSQYRSCLWSCQLYVCICNAVTEHEVSIAIDAGATTVKALNRQLGIGTQCGACVSCAKDCLSKKQSQHTNHHTMPISNVFPIIKQEQAA
jgi:bacterioferritin-associated ferredoxin